MCNLSYSAIFRSAGIYGKWVYVSESGSLGGVMVKVVEVGGWDRGLIVRILIFIGMREMWVGGEGES